jgi:hypothetical protein
VVLSIVFVLHNVIYVAFGIPCIVGVINIKHKNEIRAGAHWFVCWKFCEKADE